MSGKRVFAYSIVYQGIKKKISDGTYPVGSLIPPENELCEQFNVSRTTVRKAVNMLVSESLLWVKQGHGTQVLERKTSQRLSYITSFSETLLNKGFVVSATQVCVDHIVPPYQVSNILRMDEKKPVTRVRRVQTANEKPIAIMTNYLPPEIAPNIEKDADRLVSLYHYLENECGLVMTEGEDHITAKCADFVEAGILQIPVGSALLVNNRLTMSNGKPVEYVEMLVDAKQYEFVVYLSGRPNA